MKVAIRLQVLCIAVLACLAARAARGDEPGGRRRYPIERTSDAADENPAVPSPPSGPQSVPDPIAEGGPAVNDGATPWEDVGGGGGDTCDACGGDCGTCSSRGCLGGLWFGSVDYLLFRPRMSQAVAEVRHVEVTDQTTSPATTTTTNTAIQYPFTYQSAFRVAGGYRLLNCGGDVQVAYWRMTNDAQYRDGPVNTTNNSLLIFGNLDNNPGNGEFLNSSTGVTANIFDVDFAKSISMGGPCGTCGDCGCPRWDLRFSAGARIADISRFNDNVVVDDQGNGLSFANLNARFVGAGPRVGIQGRRYFGACGLWSLYAKASQAILIGDYRMGRTRTVPIESPAEIQITNQNDLFHRTVPVSDIEVGGTWQMAPYTYVSVGYFFQCWWDLGQGETIQGQSIPGTYFGPLDTSNILGFDGLFVRGEMLF
ncbi:MAG: Lpg1974 family pore-forming outer membrane protein [Pirellulales bacterium]